MARRRIEVSTLETDIYARECFRKETRPDVAEFAAGFGISRECLARKFKELTGLTVSEYLARRRHDFAEELLKLSNLPTHQIAYRSGYGTRRSFQRSFTARAGMTPAEYRRSLTASRP